MVTYCIIGKKTVKKRTMMKRTMMLRAASMSAEKWLYDDAKTGRQGSKGNAGIVACRLEEL
jgi:hypothetical protein